MTNTNQLQTGTEAPGFKAPDQTGAIRALEDFAGSKLVMFFYPRAFTPGCTAEACDFRDNYQAFTGAGYEIVGISPDSSDRLQAFIAEHDLPFPLLSDPEHEIAKAYGAWGLKQNYGREYEGMIRSTIAIDETGVVEHAWYNVRAKGHVARVGQDLT